MNKILGFSKSLIAALSMSTLLSSTAYAEGTSAGTVISNVFNLNYKSNGIDQTGIDNSADPTTFTVDRRIDLLTGELGSAFRESTPGQRRLVRFQFTNISNDPVEFTFSAQDNSGEDFAVVNPDVDSLWIDTTNDFQYDSATETFISYDPGDSVLLPPDEVVVLRVFVNIPLEQVNGDLASVLLTATAVDETGTILENSTTNTIDGEEIFLDDGEGEADGLSDAIHSVATDILVVAPDLSATKTAYMVSTDGSGCDGFTQPTDADNAFSLPGSCVEYIIEVTNSATTNGTQDVEATDIDLSDVLAENLILTAITHSGLGGDFDALTIPPEGLACDGTDGTCNVVYTGGSLDSGETGSIRIRARVDDN